MSVIIMILLIGLLILVHELGHLGAALLFKVKVDKFGIGLPIGPTLWEKQVGGITLVVHAFLFGGYVSFPDDDKDSDLPQNSPDRLMNKPIWQRAIIFSAGVIANVICAYALVLITALAWGNLPSGYFDTYVAKITAPKEASVWQSGMQTGDQILRINGSPIERKYSLNLYAMYSASFDGKVNEVQAEQNYEKLKKLNPAFKKDEIIPEGLIVKLPQHGEEGKTVLSDNVLNTVELYKPKEIKLTEAQKKLRDELLDKQYAETKGDYSLNDIAYAITDGRKPLEITVLREGDMVIDLNTVYSDKDGLIGIEYSQKEKLIPIKGLKSAITNSYKYLYNETKSMIIVLKQLFTGKIPLKNMHGVVLITKIGGDIIKGSSDGIFYGILLTAVISMNLAILNILPIPALDGGHLLFLLIEKIQGKPVDEEIANKIMTVFFMLLILLLIFVLFNDIYVLAKPFISSAK